MVLEAPVETVSFEVFNSGGDVNNFTKHMIVGEILKLLPTGNVIYQENGSDPRNYRVDFSKVKNVLGFETKYTIDDGIKEIVDVLKTGKFKSVDQYNDNLGNYKINEELFAQ